MELVIANVGAAVASDVSIFVPKKFVRRCGMAVQKKDFKLRILTILPGVRYRVSLDTWEAIGLDVVVTTEV